MGLLVRLFLSVCKGKQVYSENNRFSGYWSNKFRKRHCNYLFYREISIDGGGFLFTITKSQSQNHKKDFQCVKRDSYII